jgi:exopolyphosphatase / guanosine-5'-triphosphate,3'-diphosphate pyrophosphatase
VLDIGGGSTEIAFRTHNRTHSLVRISMKLGSVRLTEALLSGDPFSEGSLRNTRAHIDAELLFSLGSPSLPLHSLPKGLVGVAGTVTTLGAMDLGLIAFDATRLHGYSLRFDALSSLARRLSSMSLAERQKLAFVDPKRAEVMVAGAMIAERCMLHLGAQALTVSVRGLRWGVAEALASARTFSGG